MKRAFATLSVVAGLVLSGCGGEGGRSPAAPSSTSLAQPSSIDVQASCPSLNGDPGCFSGADIHGLTASPAAVGAPISLQGSVNGSTISLQWTKPSSGTPTSYQIEAGSASGGTNLANLNTGNTNTSFSANNVGAGTYFIRVRARDAGGVGPASNEIKLVVGGGCSTAPNAPSNLTGSVSGSSVFLKWNAPSGGCAPTSYVLHAGTSSGSSNVANSNTGNTNTSLIANGVGPGTYFLRVHAANANGVSGPSNEVKAVVGGGGGGTLAVTKFLCFGDSMTDGGLAQGLSSGGYPTRLLSLLQNAFPSQQFTVLNDAKGGERAVIGQSRLPGDLNLYHPQVLCLMEGGNDMNNSPVNVQGALNAIGNMVQAAKSRGIAVMLASIPPERPGGSKAGGLGGGNPNFLTQYNSGIQQIAGGQGATYVNVFGALNANISLFISSVDGFHPTVAGHNRIADTFFNAIVNRFSGASASTLTDDQTGWQLDFSGTPSSDQP